ncbi:hypothetical protein ACXET9_05375 [Brachybacterium sp. DNPG3]
MRDIDTLILLLFALTIAAVLLVAVTQMIAARRREQEATQQRRPRTSLERTKDARTTLIWAVAALALPCLLALAYLLTRSS